MRLSQHFLATLPGQFELVEFIEVKVCHSHFFASCLGLPALFALFRLSCLQWILRSWIRRLELHEGFIWIELADDIVLKVCGSPRIWILLIAAIASHRICRVGLFTSYLAILDFRLLEPCKGIIVVTS